jgi:hypothetical protein
MKRKSAYSPSAREKLAFKIPVRRSGQRHYSTSLKRCTPSKCASKRTFATLLPFAIARKMPVPSCQVAPGPGGKAHALSPRHGAHRGGGPPPGLRPPPGGGGPLLLALAEEGLLEVGRDPGPNGRGLPPLPGEGGRARARQSGSGRPGGAVIPGQGARALTRATFLLRQGRDQGG